MKYAFVAPLVLCVVFFGFSVWVMAHDGPFGFLAEHTRGPWSAQIGLDLVSAASLALVFAAPVARRHGVALTPWIVLTIATGSIALFALTARLLFLEYASDATAGTEGYGARGR